MNASTYGATLEKYSHRLEILDGRAQTLSDERKREYERERERFKERLRAWKRMIESDTTEFVRNVEDGYEQLEAIAFSNN